jgi:hypothetical protein
MAAVLLSTTARKRSIGGPLCRNFKSAHQRNGGMAALAAPALCVNLPTAEPHCRLTEAANPLQDDKANGKLPVETIVWRKHLVRQQPLFLASRGSIHYPKQSATAGIRFM